MDDDKLADFLQFAQKYKNKLKQIGNATKQEYTFEDVQHEAWILVETWRPDGIPINLCDSRDIDRLFAYLYAKLVRSEEHTSELQSLMRISYAVFCLKNKYT